MSMLRNIGIIAVWILGALLAVMTMIRECSAPQTARIEHDTIRTKADTIIVEREHIVPKYIMRNGEDVHDTIVREIIRTREIERVRLDSLGVRELLTLDTSIALPIMVNSSATLIPINLHTQADCIARSIRHEFRLRDTSIILDRVVPVAREKTFALGIGISYGMTLDGRMVPTLGVSISRIVFSY